MKQLLQDARTGDLAVAEVPPPQLLPGCVLVQVAASLVSAGTERASSEFASKSLLAKAKARPDLVRDVVAKLRRDGLFSTMQAVRSRLDQPQSVGYSSSGVVIAVGDGVSDVNVGDRVACAGAGYAVHAELACVPRLLLANIPQGAEVSFDEAAFGTVGAICLHGIRTAGVTLGDTVAVIGLGLLGQITVQLLRAAGCRVVGTDLVRERVDLAILRGAEGACVSADEFRDLCFQKTGGRGVDSVLITAETPSSAPVNLAAEVARDRATVVAVGTVGMDIDRKLYFGKEIEFRVSRSYGPGRYDTAYEQKGRDYPIGHVRWTETRNLEAFLQLLAERKLDLAPLITHRFPLQEATRAYDLITGRTADPFLGVLLSYPDAQVRRAFPGKIPINATATSAGSVGIGVLGAGQFARSMLLPALKSLPHVSFVGVCNATGPRSRSAAEKFGFQYCADSDEEILADPKVHAVLIASRHHLHAAQVRAAIGAGKAVFCEKPLCLTEEELASIVRAYSTQASPPALMVGFNRRFASMAGQLKKFLSSIKEPLAIHYRVNAGFIPADHWVNDLEQGGGRILGEVCHFVDFVSFLAGACPIEVECRGLGNPGQYSNDNVIASLKFADGTLGTITYLANGDKSASKERVEIFGGGSVAVLDDFRTLELVRHGRKQVTRARWRQDKGHQQEMKLFLDAVRGTANAPIPFEQVVGSTLATLRLQNACQTGYPQTVALSEFVASALQAMPVIEKEEDSQ
ncbi:MAG: bi-domain-containing oxidoreductase [Acidobacteria bacterium]|nr:bi-domain-containing oxidoreductase [Acidobacteriota bacterium]